MAAREDEKKRKAKEEAAAATVRLKAEKAKVAAAKQLETERYVCSHVLRAFPSRFVQWSLQSYA